MVLGAAVVPYGCVVAIAVGGIAVVVKLYHMSEQKEKESGDKVMNRTAAKYFRGAGIQTLGNVAVVLVAGLGLVYYVQHGSLSEQVVDWINALSIFAAVVMTRYMVIVTRSHVTRDAASRLLGWVDRPR